jgi:hypothetical protein
VWLHLGLRGSNEHEKRMKKLLVIPTDLMIGADGQARDMV